MRSCFIVLAAILLHAIPISAEQEKPKRILWIVEDSLRADHLGYMGYERAVSPWLDAFAADSVSFSRTIAPSDGTVRSVPAYLSGRYFSKLHKVTRKKQGIPAGAPSIFEVLKAAGYKTHFWSANRYVTSKRGYARGVDVFKTFLPMHGAYANIDQLMDAINASYEPGSGHEFHYVHLMDTHLPYVPPVYYDALFRKKELKTQSEGYKYSRLKYTSLWPYHANMEWPASKDHESNLELLISQYDGMIRYADDRLAQLLELFDFDKKRDILVFTADHGEQFFEQKRYGHNRDTLIPELHVPLLISYPGCKAQRIDYPVSSLDIYPTICHFLGLTPPVTVEGRSLWPDMEGKPKPRPHIFAEGSWERGASGVVISANYAYYLGAEYNPEFPFRMWPYHALYDLKADPLCKRNVLILHQVKARELNGMLRDLNPRFRNFTYDEMMRVTPPLTNGPNLFERPEKVGDGQFAFDATSLKPGIHRLRISYKLDEGELAWQLHGSKPDENLWTYVCRKPSEGRATFQVFLNLQDPKCRLIFGRSGTGSTRGTTLSAELIRVDAPTLKVVPNETIKGSMDDLHVEVNTEEDIEKLKALGYLE